MDKPTEAAEQARPNSDKRIVRVRLKVIDGSNGKEIVTELESGMIEDIFNQRDFEDFDDLTLVQGRAKANTDKRSNSALPAAERIVAAGERVHADDYPGEPPYIHAGIHLVARTRDEIEWFSDQRINFKIEVGTDPELHRVSVDLPHTNPLSRGSLHAAGFNPFVNANSAAPEPFPKFCVSGKPVRSGALRLQGNALHPDVKAQKYYKFSITVLGTEIT